MKRILTYIKPHYKTIILGLAIKFTGTLMDLLLPWSLAHMIDDIVPLKDVQLIVLWGLIMIFCSAVGLVTNITANRLAARVASDCTRKIRHDLFNKISQLSCAQMDKFTIPSLVSRLTSDTYNIHRMISMMQRLGIRAPILLIGGIIITLTQEPVLTLVLFTVLPFITLVVYTVTKKGMPLFTQLQQAVDAMVRSVRESASGIRVIKALSKTGYEKEKFAKINNKVVDSEMKAAKTMAVTNPLMNLFLNIGLTFVIIAGAYRVNAGASQPGKIISFLSYFTIISNAMMSITRMFVLYSRGGASAERISQVLESPQDMALMDMPATPGDSHIEFDCVSFSYHKKRANLSNISFRLKKGETLGIIGATGSGKSTIIKLLMRLYDPDQGAIRINGRDIRNIPPEILHTMFGVVFQDDVVFADTISENIDFGRNVGDVSVRLAAAHAQALPFIEEKELAFGHRLTARGTNISGGQKQRLLISRALAGMPEILVLDDSSSALDYKTDAGLRKALATHYQKTTKIIVAQRVSAIYKANHIMVLDDGNIIGYGGHQELLESCEPYRLISMNQMGGEILE